MTILLLVVIALLCCAMLYAHRKHQDTLTMLSGQLQVLEAAYKSLVAKIDGGAITK